MSCNPSTCCNTGPATGSCCLSKLSSSPLSSVSVIGPALPTAEEIEALPVRYRALARCLGVGMCRKLAKSRVFVVGCGAIGCELIKYLGLLGVGQEKAGGHVHLADDDTISRSNLNRQFLFREGDIDLPKAECAARSLQRANPGVAVTAYKMRLCEDSEEVFDDDFFCAVDACFSALDSLAARKYLDGRCLQLLPHSRPMLDSGTHGLEGHSCPCIPFKTASYGSEVDPEAADSVGCFVQNFPYKPAHCVQWAKMLVFDDDFASFPALLSQLLDDLRALDPADLPSALTQYLAHREAGPMRVQALAKVAATLRALRVTSLPLSFAQCLDHAVLIWHRLFVVQPSRLLAKFPPDFQAEGQPFWAPPKRPPSPLSFDPADPLVAQFIDAYARVWAASWGVSISIDHHPNLHEAAERGLAAAVAWEEAELDVADVEAEANPQEIRDQLLGGGGRGGWQPQQLAALMTPFFFGGGRPQAISFEKDGEANRHVDLIHAASNLRSRVYSIPQLSRMEVKRIAGKIAPAVATTTSTVAGFISAEFVKHVAGLPAEDFRTASLNLGLSSFVMATPGEPVTRRLTAALRVSEWERWEFAVPAATTLQELMHKIQARALHAKIDLLLEGDRMLNMARRNLTLPLSSLLEYLDELHVTYLTALFAPPDDQPTSLETFQSPPIRIQLLAFEENSKEHKEEEREIG